MFKVNLNPYVTGKLSKRQINDNIRAALIVILAYSIGVHYYLYSLAYAIKIVLIFFTIFFGAKFFNTIYYTKVSDLSFKKAKDKSKRSHLLIMSMLFTLVLPAGIPLWVVFVGTAFLISISKLVLAENGKHIINPVIVSRVLLFTLLGSLMTISFAASPSNWIVEFVFGSNAFTWLQLQGTAVDSAAGATTLVLLSNPEVLSDLAGSNINWLKQMFGITGGAIGESGRIVIIVLGLYLIKNKVIDYVIPLTMIVTVFVITLIYGSIMGYGFAYPIYQVLSGALIFSAFFIATDPYTSPKENIGKYTYGFVVGTLIVLIRILSPYPEGVMFAILIGGLMSPLLIRRYVGVRIGESSYINTDETSVETNVKKTIMFTIVTLIISIGLLFIPELASDEIVYSETAIASMENEFEFVGSTSDDEFVYYTYIVDGKNKASIEVEVVINIENNNISHVSIISHQETEGIGSLITEADFLDQFNNLEFEIETEVDMIVGATLSSRAVGTAVYQAIFDYEN